MPIRSWSVHHPLPLISFSLLGVLGACATGGALTDAELQELTQGVQSTATGAAATTTGTTGTVSSGPVAPGPGATLPTTSGGGSTSTGMLAPGAPPGTMVVPEMMETGSTEIAPAPEDEEDDPPGGSTSPIGGSAGGESAVGEGGSDSGGSSGFGTPPGGTTTPPGGGSCSDFSDTECDSLEMFAVAWCKALISCVNANCEPTADDPLCFVPNYPEDPCVTTGYANGGLGKYAQGGGNTNVAVDRAEEIIDAACGF